MEMLQGKGDIQVTARNKECEEIADDLKTVSALEDWVKNLRVGDVKCLLSHPFVEACAEDQTDLSRIAALKQRLIEVAAMLSEYEEEHSPKYDRSLAFAGTVYLRLEPKYESESLEVNRGTVAKHWKSNRLTYDEQNNTEAPKSLSPEYLRRGERKLVFLPFAEHFLAAAQAWAKAEGVEHVPFTQVGPARTSMEARVAERLRELEQKAYEDRLEEIEQDGMLKIRDEDAMLATLMMVTDLAKESFWAIDRSPINAWSTARLSQYLEHQLKRVREGGVTLERIYIFDDREIEDGKFRKDVTGFIEKHENANAKVLLCRLSLVESLELSFPRQRGLFLADGETEPITVTGMLSNHGSIGKAVIHLRKNAEVGLLRDDYQAIADAITQTGHDRKIREQLEQLAGSE